MLESILSALVFIFPFFTPLAPSTTNQNTHVLSAKAIAPPTIAATKIPTASPIPITPKIAVQVIKPAEDWLATMMQQINTYRKTKGLYAFTIHQQACAFAAIRAQEIADDFSHAGFRQRINTNSLPYTSWSEVTENIAQAKNYQEIVGLWIQSTGHEENLRKDTPFVCIGKYNDYYALVGWKP